jgi:hypothetical protein
VLPYHPLDEVKRICEEADILLDRARCTNMLTPYIDPLKCSQFARDVVALLTLDDYSGTEKIPDVPFDVYGVRLPKDLKQRYGIEQLGNFYVKLRISRPGRVVFFISLHELERGLWRRGGFLRPKDNN